MSLRAISLLKTDLTFVILFGVFAAFYYDSVLSKGPLNTHVWRQTDCLSITRAYSEGVNFFSPEMNIQLADNYTTGKTAGEFPILYYIVGNVWKVFGESYITYRLFYLIILFAGLFAFYRSLKILLAHNFWALCISLLLYTSPVYAVYGVSFLTDAPAFSFVLIALYFFLKYAQTKTKRALYISMSFFALAGLIKVSSLIAFLFLFGILTLESLSLRSLASRKLFDCNRKEWLAFISALLAIFSWYVYAHFYNDLHRFKYTFNDTWPIWLLKEGESEVLTKKIVTFTSYTFFSRPILLLLFLVGISNLFLRKRIPPFAYLANIIVILGATIYFLLWAPLMGVHDYYYIALLILFPGILLPFMWFLKTNYTSLFNGLLLKIFVGLFLLYNFMYSMSVVQLKTIAREGDFAIVGNPYFVGTMRWINWHNRSDWTRFEDMKPYLRSLGIKSEDKIISLPDETFNASLYLTGHKGWTNFNQYTKKEQIDLLIKKGAKYLLVSDTEYLKKEYLQTFLSKQIGNYDHLTIYKLE